MNIQILQDDLCEEAARLARRLKGRKCKIVFAESCTGGLVAATLVQVPGISDYLCGSSVVYREATKTEWLGIAPRTLQRHSAVSPETTIELAEQVLKRTPEADLSAAVTGYLAPAEPPEKQGLIYVAAAWRGVPAGAKPLVREYRVDRPVPLANCDQDDSGEETRVRQYQQRTAAYLVVREVNSLLETWQEIPA